MQHPMAQDFHGRQAMMSHPPHMKPDFPIAMQDNMQPHFTPQMVQNQ
jgi:hypothetical protein